MLELFRTFFTVKATSLDNLFSVFTAIEAEKLSPEFNLCFMVSFYDLSHNKVLYENSFVLLADVDLMQQDYQVKKKSK